MRPHAVRICFVYVSAYLYCWSHFWNIGLVSANLLKMMKGIRYLYSWYIKNIYYNTFNFCTPNTATEPASILFLTCIVISRAADCVASTAYISLTWVQFMYIPRAYIYIYIYACIIQYMYNCQVSALSNHIIIDTLYRRYNYRWHVNLFVLYEWMLACFLCIYGYSKLRIVHVGDLLHVSCFEYKHIVSTFGSIAKLN